MSNYLYLQCTDHEPPINSDDESGQHLYEIEQIREDITNRDQLINAAQLGMTTDNRHRNNTLRFLTRHPKCNIQIIDEYGHNHTCPCAADENYVQGVGTEYLTQPEPNCPKHGDPK